LFAESFATVAINCCVALTCTLAVVSESDTAIPAVGDVPLGELVLVSPFAQPQRDTKATKLTIKIGWSQ